MHPLEQLPDRPVVRDGVRHGLDGAEPERAVHIAAQHAPPVGPLPLRVLHVVVPRTVRLPHIDLDARDRLAVHVRDAAHDEARLALRVVTDGVAVLHGGRVVAVEGAQHGALGAARGFGVVDAIDEEGQAEDIGEEDEFLADGAAGLPDGGEEVDARAPFVGGEAGLAREVVQVRDEALEDVGQA